MILSALMSSRILSDNILSLFLIMLIGILSIIVYKTMTEKKNNKGKETEPKKKYDFADISKIVLNLEESDGKNERISDYKKINNLIDEMINEAIENYTVLNIPPDGDTYLNREKVEELNNYVRIYMEHHMTDAIVDVLKVFYKFDDRTFTLNDYIRLKIKLILIPFVAANNMPA